MNSGGLHRESLTSLKLRHADCVRWLDLPHAELWADQFAARTAEMKECWEEIQRRRELASRKDAA